MNILMITATYPPSTNGVAISTRRTVSALRSLGHRVVVIGPREAGSTDFDYLGLPTIQIPFFGLRDYPIPLPPVLPFFLRRLPRVSWDIIHVHHPIIAGQFALLLRGYLHVPVVFTYHTQYRQYIDHLWFLSRKMKQSMYEGIILSVCKKFDATIATTKWLRQELQKELPTKQIYYASTAGLAKSFLVQQSKESLRKTLSLPPEGPLFLSVSRLSVEKKTDILLRAFLYWAQTHTTGMLIIIGDGGYRGTLEKIAKLDPNGKRVRFMGKIPNESLPSWYSAADIFLYSSITDTIGINIIEAMSAGLPVVAPTHKTTREVVTSGSSGVLSADISAMSFAHAIDVALEKEGRLSEGARIVGKSYMIDHTIRTLLDVYSRVSTQYKRDKGKK